MGSQSCTTDRRLQLGAYASADVCASATAANEQRDARYARSASLQQFGGIAQSEPEFESPAATISAATTISDATARVIRPLVCFDTRTRSDAVTATGNGTSGVGKQQLGIIVDPKDAASATTILETWFCGRICAWNSQHLIDTSILISDLCDSTTVYA